MATHETSVGGCNSALSSDAARVLLAVAHSTLTRALQGAESSITTSGRGKPGALDAAIDTIDHRTLFTQGLTGATVPILSRCVASCTRTLADALGAASIIDYDRHDAEYAAWVATAWGATVSSEFFACPQARTAVWLTTECDPLQQDALLRRIVTAALARLLQAPEDAADGTSSNGAATSMTAAASSDATSTIVAADDATTTVVPPAPAPESEEQSATAPSQSIDTVTQSSQPSPAARPAGGAGRTAGATSRSQATVLQISCEPPSAQAASDGSHGFDDDDGMSSVMSSVTNVIRRVQASQRNRAGDKSSSSSAATAAAPAAGASTSSSKPTSSASVVSSTTVRPVRPVFVNRERTGKPPVHAPAPAGSKAASS